ncbi:MAG: hypothetical protein WDM94_11950 [Bauldia sp.]
MQTRTIAQSSLTGALIAGLPPTRFRDIDRRLAAAILIVTALAMLVLLAIALRFTPPAEAPDTDNGDRAMYERVVERMHAGENYYTAAHTELHDGRYGTQSVFNWRLPTLSWIDSRFPSLLWASIVLGLGAIGAVFAGAKLVRDTADKPTAYIAAFALAMCLAACATGAGVLFTEIVASVMILASASAYGLKRPAIGFVLALAALFVRELAAPYVLVCIYFAWRDGRRSELAGWAAGLVAFFAYFAWHYMMVEGQHAAGDFSYVDGWIQFGGMSFVLSTAAFNGMLLAAPLWVSAIVVPLCLLGLIGWRAPEAARIGVTVAVYMATFLIVGKAFNDYWGALYTPLMSMGLAFAPAAIRDLVTHRA